MGGRFLFLVPERNAPTGGLRKIEEIADALARAGHEAIVVKPRRRPASDSRNRIHTVTHRGAVTARHDDVVVIPEIFGDEVPSVAPGVAKVILNQNVYLARDRFFDDPSVEMIITVSEHNRTFCELAYPGCRVRRIRYGVAPGDGAVDKERLIAYMPRRRERQSTTVIRALRRLGALAGWEVVAIDGVAPAEVRSTLDRAAVFLSFSEREGFGLPPLEAMASGCLVIGYTGQAGAEFLREDTGVPVAEDDLESYVRAVADVLRAYPVATLADKVQRALEMVRTEYSQEAEERSVLATFREAADIAAARTWQKPCKLPVSPEPARARVVGHHLRLALGSAFRRR